MILNFLECVIKNNDLHWRWLNTLSYLEYIGARKIIKSQREDNISDMVINHMVEEIHHAHFFKKIIRRVFLGEDTTYAARDMLGKAAAKHYIQQVDAYCASGARDEYHAYMLTSYVVELRALMLYKIYDDLLKKDGRFRLTSILKQETSHLKHMATMLNANDKEFRVIKHDVCCFEEKSFGELITALYKDITQHDSSPY